jgi:hypothetical protein
MLRSQNVGNAAQNGDSRDDKNPGFHTPHIIPQAYLF